MKDKIIEIKREYYLDVESREKWRKKHEEHEARRAALDLKIEVPPIWLKFAEEILKGRTPEEEEQYHQQSLENDEMLRALYLQLENFIPYYCSDKHQALSTCKHIDTIVLGNLVKLEKNETALEIKKFDGFDIPFLNYIAYKYASSYLSRKEIHTVIEKNEEHYIFKLICEDIANQGIKDLGFQFVVADNILGWKLVKIENEKPDGRPIEKIDWQGNQALLAYLFRQLEDKGIISNKNYVEYLSNHFTFNGNEINRDSLKTAVSKAQLASKNYLDKTPIEKQVENISTYIPKLNEILKELERIIDK